ncbi:PD-(D/E)XK nuclease family protein [uncultured Brachyspira sp.]|uniref:PDDEXK-like family protein n=1 Tax=uncultured Brachyspira sp. TaxID=221953 RepID=UPI00261FAD95|nr:PD-(D/E)XK nuclease family protein [uncultured Brachyspira sp.]
MNTEIIENTLLALINEFKKDEEEKYNAVENTIKSIHKSFLEEEELKTNILNQIFPKIKTIIEEVKEEMKKYPPQFCIFDAVNLQRYENYNSNLLANFLKINIEYEGTKLSFVKDFLIYLNNKLKWDYYGLKSIEELEKINHSDINIKREKYAYRRRMDLFISYKKDFAIIIENKIYASDQPNQLNDYYKKNQDIYNNIYIIYLTPYGNEPNENSLSSNVRKELGDNFKTLKHCDIALWLENILENEKYCFFHKENILFKENDNKYIKDYRLLKSAMIQTIHNANMLGNNTKEIDMTKEKIRKLLKENIFEDIQTVEDAEEYKKIFNSVIDIINEKEWSIKAKPHIEFTQKVLDYLKKNGESKSYTFLAEKEILNGIVNKNKYPHNIEFKTINEANVILENNNNGTDIDFHFGIYTENERTIKKIKKLDEEINNIFEKFSKDSSGWIYII